MRTCDGWEIPDRAARVRNDGITEARGSLGLVAVYVDFWALNRHIAFNMSIE